MANKTKGRERFTCAPTVPMPEYMKEALRLRAAEQRVPETVLMRRFIALGLGIPEPGTVAEAAA